jgi:hypothetical protein
MESKMITIGDEGWWYSNDLEYFHETPKRKFKGYIYVVEFKNTYTGSNNIVKIGASRNPYKELKNYNYEAMSYYSLIINKIILSAWHINYKENESLLHKSFKDRKIELGDLYCITLDVFIEICPVLNFNCEDQTPKV